MVVRRLIRRLPPAAVAAVAAVAGSLPGSAGAAHAGHLFGPTSLRSLEQVTYRATGLVAATGYALLLVGDVRVAGRVERCTLYMAAPRRASGTELFSGSVPNQLTCSGQGGERQVSLRRGRYRAVVCVPVSSTGACRAGASVVRLRVRVV